MDASEEVVAWLLDGDVSVRYQTRRDLLDDDDPTLQARMSSEGYAAALLAARSAGGGWGRAYYQPKWTSTHYTLLELRNLGLAPDEPVAREAVARVLRDHLRPDGGIDPGAGWSDTCVNGMALSFCSWFGGEPSALARMVDWLLGERLPDGGFNCRADRSGATHSSHHTTVSVLEGLATYLSSGQDHRRPEVESAVSGCADYLLAHRLFRSHRTGEVIHPEFVRLHHPPRWHFDVLRGLDALAAAGVPPDPRMDDALWVLSSLRRPDGTWPPGRTWPGETHVPMDRADRSRCLTLHALRVLRGYAR
jgi:hypothetical protein